MSTDAVYVHSEENDWELDITYSDDGSIWPRTASQSSNKKYFSYGGNNGEFYYHNLETENKEEI